MKTTHKLYDLWLDLGFPTPKTKAPWYKSHYWDNKVNLHIGWLFGASSMVNLLEVIMVMLENVPAFRSYVLKPLGVRLHGTVPATCFQRDQGGLPWWHSGWEPACQCRGHGFEPWTGKIPHAPEQLSPCATTTEPQLLEAVLHSKEKPLQWEAHAPQRRTSTAQNK